MFVSLMMVYLKREMVFLCLVIVALSGRIPMSVELDRAVHSLLGLCEHKLKMIGGNEFFHDIICERCNFSDTFFGMIEDIDDLSMPEYSSDLNIAWPLLTMTVELICENVEESDADYFVQKVCSLDITASSDEVATYICEEFVKVKSNLIPKSKVKEVM